MNSSILRLTVLPIATLCLSACGLATSDRTITVCPPWPVAGDAVAAELEALTAGAFPATWEWIGRLDRLRQQLETCR